jgi:hypothetical protein
LPAIALTYNKAGYRPNPFVILIFVPSLPRNRTVPQLSVSNSWLYRAPSNRFVIKIGDKPAGGVRFRIPAISLGTQQESTFLVIGLEPSGVRNLEPLTIALNPVTLGRTEDRLQVLP